MKKVLYFTSSYQIGLTTLLTEQACSLVGHVPDQFLFISGEKEQLPGLFEKLRAHGALIKTIYGFDDHLNFFRLVREFHATVQEFQPMVVHVQTNWQLGIAVLVKYVYGFSYSLFYTLHGYRHNYKLRSFFARYLIGMSLSLFVDKLYVSSTFLKNKFKFVKSKTEILFLGVDEEFFLATHPLPSFQEKKIIFPGEFRVGKNQEMLIRAIKRYISQTGDYTIQLLLPGTGKNMEQCKHLAHALGIEKNIVFPGFINRTQLLALYLQCHCAVIPTNIETFGLSIVEPFVLGRVVLTRNVGIADDIIVHGYNGFLFDTESELTDLLRMLFTNTLLLQQIAQRTVEHRNIFRWDEITQQYIRSLNNFIDLKKSVSQVTVQHPKHVMIIWSKFLPYHIARIKNLKKRLNEIGCTLTAVEVASKDGLYPFGDTTKDAMIDYISCFTGISYRDLTSRKIFDRVYMLLCKLKPDVVFAPATPFPSGMASAKYRLESDSRSILMDDAWEHSDRRGAVVKWIKKNIHKNIDAAFLPSPSHTPYFQKLGFSSDRIVYGVDVVDNEHFAQRAERTRASSEQIRVQLGLPKKYFLFVGRFLPIKGISTLLKAYALYCSKVAEPWDIVFVGDGVEKRSILLEAGHLPGIHLAGTKTGEELCQHYALASALVISSDAETWGLVVNEAMASSLPVIVSRGCGCAKTLVEEGKNGWTFPLRDFKVLASVMAQCSSLSQQELDAMGKKSFSIIHQWSLDTFADGVIAALEIPRRERADMIANTLTNFWTGRISMYP